MLTIFHRLSLTQAALFLGNHLPFIRKLFILEFQCNSADLQVTCGAPRTWYEPSCVWVSFYMLNLLCSMMFSCQHVVCIINQQQAPALVGLWASYVLGPSRHDLTSRHFSFASLEDSLPAQKPTLDLRRDIGVVRAVYGLVKGGKVRHYMLCHPTKTALIFL